ncbi:MAG: DUF1501 domain-containing protein [Pirellulales bacterium]
MYFSCCLNRRELLQVSLGGLAGVASPKMLSAAESGARGEGFAGERSAGFGRANACILLYMDGGPSQLDLWDLKPAAPAEIRGPWKPIDTTVPGLRIGEHLPLVARQMHHATLVRSVCHQETVHDPAVYQMLTGTKHISSAGGLKVEATDAPHLGAAFAYADTVPAVMPKLIQLPETMRMQDRVLPGQNAGYLGSTFDPFPIEITRSGQVERPRLAPQPGLPLPRMAGFSSLVKHLNGSPSRVDATLEIERFEAFQQQALEILSRPGIEAAFDLEREDGPTRDRYGRHRHGQSVLLARRMVEAGARFVTVYWGREPQDWADGRAPQVANNPWDTHRNHFPLVKDTLCPPADRALAALLEDLHLRGLLDETLVVWMGDFGRTPRISRPWGSRDHWPGAFSILLAGAGVRRGAIYGQTDQHAAAVTDSPLGPGDLAATIYYSLGLDPAAPIPAAQGGTRPLSPGRMVSGLLG